MASSESRVPSGVIARLFREGYMFEFFQTVRLLESYFAEGKSPGESSDVEEERIRFRPHHGLVFPATDVRSVELLEGTPARARVTATFMGLYGADSPLPVYFYNAIATESEESRPLRDFLDIFNHRLYALFYRSWKKYRLALHSGTPSLQKTLEERALSMAGLGTRDTVEGAPMPPIRLAAFAGSLSPRVRNSDGLRNLVTELLDGVQVSVVENVLRWVAIPERSRLGRQGRLTAVLASSACLGERVSDASGKFRLALGPLTLTQYLALLPGGPAAAVLQYLVRLYVRDYLDYDAELKLRTAEIPTLRLSDTDLRLGLTTWVGKPGTTTTSRVVAYN